MFGLVCAPPNPEADCARDCSITPEDLTLLSAFDGRYYHFVRSDKLRLVAEMFALTPCDDQENACRRKNNDVCLS